jgi:type IV pilus assembly protein PilC
LNIRLNNKKILTKTPMSLYRYKALTKENDSVIGLVEAVTETAAVDLLRDKGMVIISLQEEDRRNLHFNIDIDIINTKDIVVFTRQFSVLISASVTMVQALNILSEQTDKMKFKKIIREISDEVDGGARLSESLAKRPNLFSGFYVNVVKSGETSGRLDEVLQYLADEIEKDYDMISKIRGAMIYPGVILAGLISVGAVMMIFVIPNLTSIFREGGGELPLATRILIGVSDFFVSYWWLMIIILFGLVTGAVMFVRTNEGKKYTDTILLSLPVFGNLFKKIYLVRFARSLKTLITGGVTVSKSLTISAEVVNNYVFSELIKKTKQEIEDGNSISSAFAESKYVPKMVSQMMAIGERTGRLDLILSKVTDFYTREINNTIANLMVLMEPFIIIMLGLGVGTMVAAIIMPMYNMANQF